MTPLTALRTAGELVRFSHTVFALPFALIGLLAASGGLPDARILLWIVVAMVAGRTAAMAFNRLVDQRIDAANPRTAGRHLPAGLISRRFAWTLVVAGGVLLVVAAGQLNPLCLMLSPLALAWILAYSSTKRWTSLSHVWLGASLGLAPLGAWLAVRGAVAPQPLLLAAAVTVWVAGFDVLYSLQDEAFDRRLGLRSLPARLGGRRAILVARGLHATATALFAGFAGAVGAGPGLWLGIVLAAALLIWQHSLIAPGRLERLNTAFFTANGALSLVMLGLYVLDMMRSP